MTSYSTFSRRSGFTLVEALIALALMAVIMVAIGSSLKNATQSARVNALTADTRQQATNGLNYILNAIRQAKMIHLYDDAGNEVALGTYTGTKLKVVKTTDPTNGNELVYSIIDLDTSNGHSYLRVTSENGTSDPALDSVTSLNFTVPLESDGFTRRMVTVNMAVRIADPMVPNDLTKAKILNLQATEVARCIIKP